MDTRNLNGRLSYSVKRNDLKKIKQLIKEGADVNAYVDAGINTKFYGFKWTSLHVAIESNNIEVVNVLLEAGANIHSVDMDHSCSGAYLTSMHLVCSSEMKQILISEMNKTNPSTLSTDDKIGYELNRKLIEAPKLPNNAPIIVTWVPKEKGASLPDGKNSRFNYLKILKNQKLKYNEDRDIYLVINGPGFLPGQVEELRSQLKAVKEVHVADLHDYDWNEVDKGWKIDGESIESIKQYYKDMYNMPINDSNKSNRRTYFADEIDTFRMIALAILEQFTKSKGGIYMDFDNLETVKATLSKNVTISRGVLLEYCSDKIYQSLMKYHANNDFIAISNPSIARDIIDLSKEKVSREIGESCTRNGVDTFFMRNLKCIKYKGHDLYNTNDFLFKYNGGKSCQPKNPQTWFFSSHLYKEQYQKEIKNLNSKDEEQTQWKEKVKTELEKPVVEGINSGKHVS
ncbi:ankyrin repeat domain-containing protein [Wolbachia endosymbiont of Pentidionis agamae]|uniref:ankyrin repeat domain-containing protein n=1 Tax=Wolbachia endosymbiont of Pentidionis agamae TaxID=3110435 RepID=UPI002FD1CE54